MTEATWHTWLGPCSAYMSELKDGTPICFECRYKQFEWAPKAINFAAQVEVAAALQAVLSYGYSQGFEHGVTAREFCEPQAGDSTYFPLDLRYWKGVRHA